MIAMNVLFQIILRDAFAEFLHLIHLLQLIANS